MVGAERQTLDKGHMPCVLTLSCRPSCSGTTSFTTLRKQALVTEMQLRHRDLRALEPGVALPCA